MADAVGPSIVPVILSGGSGTRLWPMSRSAYPKQFLPLASGDSLLQDTLTRMSGVPFTGPMVICNEAHRFVVAEQARAIGLEPEAIVLEPVGRNTAPAAAAAALLAREAHPGALVLLAPSDHVIAKPEVFRQAVMDAVPAALDGRIVTFGIVPDKPETGFGYIKMGEAVVEGSKVHRVERFLEKPDLATAERMLAQGGYLWNGGLFLFQVDSFLVEMERHAPEILEGTRAALEAATTDIDFTRLDRALFEAIKGDSLDYAVMERTDKAAVIASDIGWSDLGAWSALWEIGEKDGAGNVTRGDVLLHDVSGSYVRSEGPLVAVAGMDDVLVIATDDATLVAPLDRAQDVKALVEILKAQGRTEQAHHTLVFRPWGSYQGIHMGDRHQVKHIVVKPGACLSLQMHHHRAEHWIVVRGTAKVTRGEDSFLLRENESTYIPLGTTHRLENPGILPLHLIEVQSGAYLGEDDIVRFVDNYGRQEQEQ
ncbi:MAG: mannose-1-phosphate guanylyltransferase/mannose-6-phosphate isomerase [Rhodospirillum sp.]|nr:mannose-1-phosphate guanylyltransferase/mannose-6-phosphate isomerase [Rhodospirillum sp.]MCF8488205.1 mannose-1-phosphate guanylyltransferase/mannose-6-phosphate isomerase [Rhodospirillum sp.]MCF8501196.1 mannose-1-phosphate guanylyltransferase/mannose-6-phosphate isomerase [Rhodospirillum sp.]